MTPENEKQLGEAIRDAAGPLRIEGGGTRPIGKPVEGTRLSTTGLSGITLYEPGALTLVARAGTSLAEIEAALAQENQRLAFEPPDLRSLLGRGGSPTIGGTVATNASGPRRIAVGACRDHMLGLRFVDGTGQILKNGGRVMKNVTGYDLVKLLTGSYGTLGVLSEVSLKVLPRPETRATLSVEGLEDAHAAEAMAVALGSPFEVTGAVWDVAGTVHIRIEGFAASVDYRAAKLAEILERFGPVTRREGGAGMWQDVRDVTAFKDKEVVVRLSIKPSRLGELSFAARNAFVDYANRRDTFDMMADWGGGLVWIGADADQLAACATALEGEPTAARGAEALVHFLQSFCAAEGGHSTLIKGSEALRRAVPVFQPENAIVAGLSAGLRAKFDPRGILNPGVMG